MCSLQTNNDTIIKKMKFLFITPTLAWVSFEAVASFSAARMWDMDATLGYAGCILTARTLRYNIHTVKIILKQRAMLLPVFQNFSFNNKLFGLPFKLTMKTFSIFHFSSSKSKLIYANCFSLFSMSIQFHKSIVSHLNVLWSTRNFEPKKWLSELRMKCPPRF